MHRQRLTCSLALLCVAALAACHFPGGDPHTDCGPEPDGGSGGGDPLHFTGFVHESRTRAPIPNALVTVRDGTGSAIAYATSSVDGSWDSDLPATFDFPLRFRAEHEGFTSLTFEVRDPVATNSLGFMLAPSNSINLTPGDIGTLISPDGGAELTIPAAVLTTLDGAIPRFPVRVELSAMDPDIDAVMMPGIGMLSENPFTGELRPLTGIGGVLIEATDADGNTVRVDEALELSTGLQVRLDVDVTGYALPGSPPPGLRVWNLDQETGPFTWQSGGALGDVSASQAWQDGQTVLATLPTDYMQGYATYIAGLLNGYWQGSPSEYRGCPNGVVEIAEEIRLNVQVDEERLLDRLSGLMLMDSGGALNPLCTWSNLFYDLSGRLGVIYDARFAGQWYDAGTYSCPGDDSWSSFPGSYAGSPTYDTTHIEPLRTQVCSVFVADGHLLSLGSTGIDLVSLLLGYEHPAAPIEILLDESSGDGRFRAEVAVDDAGGRFVSGLNVEDANAPIALRALVPESSFLRLNLSADPAQPRADQVRYSSAPASMASYRFASPESASIVDFSTGAAPDWLQVDDVNF